MDYLNPPTLWVALHRVLYTKKEDANFIVEKFLCIVNIIIPFFNKYTIIGIKASDLKDFKKVA